MKRWIWIAVLLAVSAAKAEWVDEVNPLIGTMTLEGFGGHGLGKTFPGAATPFGMIQLSPDTITGGDNGPGYSYHHTTIEGFSFTHLSGIGWYGDLGNFEVQPTVGNRVLDREQAVSLFSHDCEMASAGYYRVKLRRYGVTVELTAAPRAGMLRFTYPEAPIARIQIDLARRIGQASRWLRYSCQSVHVVDSQTIEGFMRCSSRDGGWGHGDGQVNYTQYFRAAFSKPFTAFGVWDRDRVLESVRDYTGTNTGFFAEFPTAEGEAVSLRAGFSYVDLAGARENLARDIPDFDFERVRSRARTSWSAALGALQVEGGTPRERRIFATALYHAMIDPRLVADADGRFMGADGHVQTNRTFHARTVFSGWDVFRSEFPLLTLVCPDVVADEINSLLQVMRLTGRSTLPRWDLFGCPSGCMIGHPAIPVILDAYEKGIRHFDVPLAYELCRKTLESRESNQPLGFTPGSLSMTLEYAYDDWCVSRLAMRLGKADDARRFADRAMAYTNCWCPEVKWMRARLHPGPSGQTVWLKWNGKTGQNQGTIESNPYQQGWFVPHDVHGLIRLMGGEEIFADELETFFEKTPADFFWNDYYNQPNEPCHHLAYLFPFAGRPWLTQKWTRQICERAYDDNVLGLCGNDDVGQMSAWYVLSAMGLHPVCPGDGIYVLTSPVFPKVTLRLPKSGACFTVSAPGTSLKNRYIQSATLNGHPLHRAWITYGELAAGGTLALVMGPEPNKSEFEIKSWPIRNSGTSEP